MLLCARLPLRVSRAPPLASLNPRRSVTTSRLHGALAMELDLGFEQLSDARWTEILPLIQQYRVLRLQDCGLSEARCKELGPALHTSPALVELDLGLNDLGDAGVHLVLRGLQSPSCKIQKLILQGCSLTHVGCGALPGALRRVPSLLELHLGGNVLGDAGLRLLCEGLLAPECHIVKLWLDSCGLTASSCEHLAAVLRAKPDFKELVLSNNDIQDAGVHTLCQALRGSACQLELLKLENCELTPASCAAVCGALASLPSLQVLDMSRNKLGDKGISLLCPELRRSSLRNLWLWQCDITAEGCKDLCGVLGMKPSLKELSLSMNELGDEGARLLCESLLQPGCQLESLWLDTCSFTAACCSYFRPVLLQSQSLLELRLCDNPLGDAGVQELCKALSSPDTALRTLCLVDCGASDASCGSIATALQTNRSLQCLDLSNSCMGDPGVLQLLESLRQHNCALEKLILFDIYWTEAVEEQIVILQEEKPNLRIIC